MKNSLSKLCVFFMVTILLPACAWADEDLSANPKGFAHTMMEEAKSDATAQSFLAIMYEKGIGVDKDETQALQWYQKAAAQGEGGAMSKLGLLYEQGVGVAKDKAQAMGWYRKVAKQEFDLIQSGQGMSVVGDVDSVTDAATQGNPFAQTTLGVMYDRGERGVSKDEAEAVKWYRKSAEQGQINAQYFLGLMYLDGRGVAQDEAEALKWFQQGAETSAATLESGVRSSYELSEIYGTLPQD